MTVLLNEKKEFIERKISAPGKMSDVHCHNGYEMYFLEKGSVRYFIGNEIFLLEEGDIAFIPKKVFHKTDSTHSERAVERLLLSFDDDFILPNWRDYINEMEKDRYIRFNKGAMGIIEDVFRRMEIEENKKLSDYKILEQLYFGELLIYISRYRMIDSKNTLSESYKIIENAAKYISENYGSDICLENLAKRFAMSPGHFSKQFKKLTGVGVNEYINISRITAAEKLFEKTNMSVTEVAFKCGFNDSNYFAVVFKKLKGITPKRYSIINKQ